MDILVDSSAWIDYLEGAGVGERVSTVLDKANRVYILPVILAEVVSKAMRQGSRADVAYEALMSRADALPISLSLARQAGLLHAEMRKKRKGFGLADAFIVVAAKSAGAKIVTKDDHFKGFKEAMLLT